VGNWVLVQVKKMLAIFCNHSSCTGSESAGAEARKLFPLLRHEFILSSVPAEFRFGKACPVREVALICALTFSHNGLEVVDAGSCSGGLHSWCQGKHVNDMCASFPM